MIKLKDASAQLGIDIVTLYNYADRKDTPLHIKTSGRFYTFDKDEWEKFKNSDDCIALLNEIKTKQEEAEAKARKRARREKRKQKKLEALGIEVKKEKKETENEIVKNDIENFVVEEFDDSAFLNIKEDPKEKIIIEKDNKNVFEDAEEEWLSTVIQDKLYDKDGNVLYDFTKYPEPTAPKGDEPLYLTDWQIQEIKRCKNILYFAHHYIWVKGGKGIEKFEPRAFQSDYFRCFLPSSIKKGIKDLILVYGRQMGKCFDINTKVRIRNKKSKEIAEITVKDFIENILRQK